MQHGQVGGLADLVDERGQRPPGDPLQRLLPGVAGADLERGDADAVALLLGQVDDEALLDHGGQEVVGRGARIPTAAVTRSNGTGSGCAARNRSTRSARVAEGT